jgi:hypothetical protein
MRNLKKTRSLPDVLKKRAILLIFKFLHPDSHLLILACQAPEVVRRTCFVTTVTFVTSVFTVDFAVAVLLLLVAESST